MTDLAIPEWIQTFVVIGIAMVILVIPIRIVWEATRNSRESGKKIRDFADRLRERFAEVEFLRGMFSTDRVRFKHQDKKITVYLPSEKHLIIKIDEEITPPFHAYICEKSWLNRSRKFLWESLRMLRRFKVHDTLLDDRIAIYSSHSFGYYLTELALDGTRLEGKPEGVAESLVVVSKLPGLKKFKLTMSPAAGMRLHLKVTTEDMLYRPDQFEAAIHHLIQLYDSFVMI